MCGISGIITENDKQINKEYLIRINDKIKHRGPDAEGFYIYKNVAFGHRRLSIIDLSESGNQPMVYGDDLVITYNGEIYNYLELKSELLQLGYTFSNSTDTEVVLAAYDAWGVDCLQKFNGMWAFAILDKSKNKVFISRDRFGVKPLYYSENSGNFVFGSEIKQLLKEKDNLVNIEVLIEGMLTYIDNHTSKTYFDGVYSLLPGHFMMYDLKNNSFEIKRYYTLKPDQRVSEMTFNDGVEYLRDLLVSSINLRLRSDVKLGACLSGGLDSSTISAIANSMYIHSSGRKFTAIHARSIEMNTDESTYAKNVSEFLDLDLHIVSPSTKHFKTLVDELVYTQEEPFGSPSMFMGYLVFKKANKLGCKVMLNGQGGDEILLGYERYFASFLYNLSFSKFLKQLWMQQENSGLKFFDPFLYFFYFTSFRLRKAWLKKRSFLVNSLKDSFQFKELKRSIESFKSISNLQMHEISVVQLPHLLRYEDRNSMRHSIETRLPFLDYRLVEAGISFLPTYKIWNGWTKYILRKSIDGFLPKHIVWRKNKLGFNAPEKIWLTAHLDEMINEIKKSELLKKITDFNKLIKKYNNLSYKEQWLYYNIAVWERVYDVKYKH